MGKRESDKQGPSTGQRIHMWLSSAKILYGLVIPLLAGMSAYGTSDTVRTAVQRVINPATVPVASGEVVAPVVGEQDPWRAQVNQSLITIVNKLSELESSIEAGGAESEKDDQAIWSEIDRIKRLLTIK